LDPYLYLFEIVRKTSLNPYQRIQKRAQAFCWNG
jgi:hypothetical protein